MTGKYHIRHITEGDDAYVLCDSDGNPVPCQSRTSLASQAGELPTFTVEFKAGEFGLQVVDEREDI